MSYPDTSVHRKKLRNDRPGADPFWQGRRLGTDRVSSTVGGARRASSRYAEIQNTPYGPTQMTAADLSSQAKRRVFGATARLDPAQPCCPPVTRCRQRQAARLRGRAPVPRTISWPFVLVVANSEDQQRPPSPNIPMPPTARHPQFVFADEQVTRDAPREELEAGGNVSDPTFARPGSNAQICWWRRRHRLTASTIAGSSASGGGSQASAVSLSAEARRTARPQVCGNFFAVTE